jgi:nicotinamide-nucleotide amidase
METNKSMANKNISAEIITIGDELLIGQTVDTNSAFMGTILNLNGIGVKQITSISDDETHILTTLKEAQQRADIILISGGLGPTKDDITKKTLCKYFNTTMRFDEGAYSNVERIFQSFGREVTPINRLQAEVPANATVVPNVNGTAPCMWFSEQGTIFVSMPGVPYELKALMTDEIIPRLKQTFNLPHILHKTVLTQGVGESFLAAMIADWEDGLAQHNIKLAYLPSPGMVKLRLSTKGDDKAQLENTVNKQIETLTLLIKEHIYGIEEFGAERLTLQQQIGTLLSNHQKSIATAESCTGGYISHLITSIAGSSNYYKGSVIAYANEVKTNELRIPTETIAKHGAVSKEVVELMAENVRLKFKTDYAISTSGIAGPDGGTEEKPVGTVWIAVAYAEGCFSQQFQFGKNRERNIQKAADAALNMLRKKLEK